MCTFSLHLNSVSVHTVDEAAKWTLRYAEHGVVCGLIDDINQRKARLALLCVTVFRQVNHQCNQPTRSTQPSIPRIGKMRIGLGYESKDRHSSYRSQINARVTWVCRYYCEIS